MLSHLILSGDTNAYGIIVQFWWPLSTSASTQSTINIIVGVSLIFGTSATRTEREKRNESHAFGRALHLYASIEVSLNITSSSSLFLADDHYYSPPNDARALFQPLYQPTDGDRPTDRPTYRPNELQYTDCALPGLIPPPARRGGEPVLSYYINKLCSVHMQGCQRSQLQ